MTHRHPLPLVLAILMVMVALPLGAGNGRTSSTGTVDYQPPVLPKTQLDLREAVALAIEHDPNVYLAREDTREQEGTLRESTGLFDLALVLDASYQLNSSQLTDGQRDFENAKRRVLRTSANILQELADDLRDQLAEEAGFVYPSCEPGLILIVAGETICVSPEEQAQIQLTGDLAGALGLDETQQQLIQWNRTIANTLLVILDDAALQVREALRRFGQIPDFEDKTTITFDLGLVKSFRNGMLIRPGVFLESTRDVYRGKRVEAEYGGKGKPDTVKSEISLRLDVPLGKGRGRISAGAPERAADLNYAASIATQAHTISQTVQSAAFAYWGLLAAQDRVQLLERSVEINRRIQEIGTALLDADEIVEGDLAQTRARLAEASAQYRQARQVELEARQRLADAIGLLVERVENLPVATDSWPDLPEPAELAAMTGRQLHELALQNRADVTAARLRQESAQVLADAARADLKARTNLSLTVAYNGLHEGRNITSAGGLLDNWGDALFGWYPGPSGKLALDFEWPFKNNVARGRYAQSRALLNQSAISATDLQRVISSNVERLLGSLKEAVREVNNRQVSTEHYRQLVTSQVEKFQLGESSVFEVILSEQDKVAQELALVSARQTLASLVTQLRFETGALLQYRTEDGRVLVENLQLVGYRFEP